MNKFIKIDQKNEFENIGRSTMSLRD